MPNTPWVFCAVSAVTAVMAKPPSAVTALMSAWMPAPPPESDPATISTRPRISMSPSRSRLTCHVRDRRGDLVDDRADRRAILAFGHHADHRLGAGFADQQPSVGAEPQLGGGDRRLDRRMLERRLAVAAVPVLLVVMGNRLDLLPHPRR